MSRRSPWLLPDGVDELLPPRTRALEALRRRLLDTFERWGYELVIPPLIEYLDSLLSGIGEDLDLQTFKLVDQVSGRMLGVRADMTPQVARIDAHRRPVEAPQRLCYVGPVVHTLPDKFAGSRNPLQLGAELYGHRGIEADAEIIALLHEVLRVAEVPAPTIEIGHMGLFHAICESASFDADLESRLLEHLLMKDAGSLENELQAANAPADVIRHLEALLMLNGGTEVLQEARNSLRAAPASVASALDDVAALVELLDALAPSADVHLDFGELRGYRYHTGVMFAAYTPAAGRAIAWGGRYDNVGASFGRERPATGFSTDLKVLAALSGTRRVELKRILAPAGTAPELIEAIRNLRAAGYMVIQALPGQHGGAAEVGCEQYLSDRTGSWQVEDV